MKAWKKAAFAGMLAGCTFILSGYYSGDQERVEITYTVQPGDTLWAIGERHLPLNTGGRRYLPEFIEGIKELNPQVKENHYVIHPGDKLQIAYWRVRDD